MATPLPLSNVCPYCGGSMQPSAMSCGHCRLTIQATFPATPLGSLPTEHQRFIEMFVLASGNLKEIAALAGVSYPTVRNRLDRVIESLQVAVTSAATTESRRVPGGQEPSAAEIIKRVT